MNATEFIHEWVEAYNEMDFTRFAAMNTDDVVYTVAALGHTYTGRDAFIQHIREYADGVPDRRFTLDQVIADGDLIAVEYRFLGTSSGKVAALPPAGTVLKTSFCSVLRLRDGKVAAQTDYLGG
ncbi:nuclear transport factor 2 family protein [Nocardia sp. NPDC052566]|uniref:nuclear transport factor 2 family protein n=1 Tax=Nocardia sp. NPDC052566 TaxID=3364330 RepID=UPI0037C85ECA